MLDCEGICVVLGADFRATLRSPTNPAMESYYSPLIVAETLLQEKFAKTKFLNAHSVAFHFFPVEANNFFLMNHHKLTVRSRREKSWNN